MVSDTAAAVAGRARRPRPPAGRRRRARARSTTRRRRSNTRARLNALADRYADHLIVVMRCYFEKPRTSVGWKGLINDPGSRRELPHQQGAAPGPQAAAGRERPGLPTASEFLDTQIPQHIADLTSWVAIGARTTESQVHRELASGLSMPVGFKNGTDGSVQTAVDAVLAARSPHWFPSVTKQGVSAIFQTTGNDDLPRDSARRHRAPVRTTTPDTCATSARSCAQGAARDR